MLKIHKSLIKLEEQKSTEPLMSIALEAICEMLKQTNGLSASTSTGFLSSLASGIQE
jgi:hypothetical protein